MDDELRKAFATLSAQMSDISRDTHALHMGQRETLVEVRHLGTRVHRLERQVFGSDPPPAAGAEPLSRQVSEHDGDIAHLAGRVLGVEAKVDKLTEMQTQQTAILTRLDKIAANPMVRRVAYAVGGLIVAYATAKGLVLR